MAVPVLGVTLGSSQHPRGVLAPRQETAMTATARVEATEQPRLGSLRRIAPVAGAFYILTFVSVPVLVLYGPVHDPTYIIGPGPDNGVVYGVLLELVVALGGIGTAVTLFPVVRRQNESLALGFVATRTLEAA